MRGFIVGIICVLSAVNMQAQSLVLDKVLAKVGNEYVLL